MEPVLLKNYTLAIAQRLEVTYSSRPLHSRLKRRSCQFWVLTERGLLSEAILFIKLDRAGQFIPQDLQAPHRPQHMYKHVRPEADGGVSDPPSSTTSGHGRGRVPISHAWDKGHKTENLPEKGLWKKTQTVRPTKHSSLVGETEYQVLPSSGKEWPL